MLSSGSLARFVARAATAVVLGLFMDAAPAAASTPSITILASTTEGAAPLVVTFEAHGDAVAYRWQFGNGETAEGPTASATYGPGLWTVEVNGTAADGATAQATIVVRSVAVAVLPMPESRYLRSALFRGSVVPSLPGEQVALYARGRKVAATHAASDGTFRLRLPRVRTPGPYEVRTPVASSAPLALRVHPLLETSFVGARTFDGRLALVARARPAGAGTLVIRVFRDERLVRTARAGVVVTVAVATDRIASYRAVVRLEPARGWLGAVHVARARVVLPPLVPGSREATAGDLVFRYYAGLGYRFQPLLSFAALNGTVSQRWPHATRRLVSALLARAVRSGDALYWEYDFSYAGNPAPWRSGFVQAVAAQALARAGVMLGDTSLRTAAAAAFRGLRRLLIPLAGGSWIREYGFTNQAILNAQLQSIIALEAYAAVTKSAAASGVVHDLVVAAHRLLPRFELGCWARYELGGAAATLKYQTYHVELLRRLAAIREEPIWRRMYARWSRCLPGSDTG